MLLHGVSGNSMHWRFQFAGLSDRYRVIAWNAPGYMLTDGFKTDRPAAGITVTHSPISSPLSKLDRVRIVGNSFGTRVAQCFAIHHPGRVIKMAMTGIGIGPRDMPEDEKAKIIAAARRRSARRRLQSRQRARDGAARTEVAARDRARWSQNVLRATNPRGFMHGVGLGLADGYSPDEVAPRLDFPVLLISRQRGSRQPDRQQRLPS